VKAAAEAKGASIPESLRAALAPVAVGEPARAIAKSLLQGTRTAIFLGNLAQHHPQAEQLHALASSRFRC
jgi:NADH-quinone oxidoreductase subunit G